MLGYIGVLSSLRSGVVVFYPSNQIRGGLTNICTYATAATYDTILGVFEK